MGAAITVKEEERYLFSVVSGQVDRLNIESGVWDMLSKELWWVWGEAPFHTFPG